MEIYRGWKIEKSIYMQSYFEAINTKDCDSEIIYSRNIEDLKKEIDMYISSLYESTFLTRLSKVIHKNNKKKGFYEKERNIGEILCLIHSEISEALEAHRNSKKTKILCVNTANKLKIDLEFKDYFKKNIKDNFEDEIADVLIRVLDLCAYMEIDIDSHLKAKMRYNSLRDYKHGKKY